jgi:IS30 family transposase
VLKKELLSHLRSKRSMRRSEPVDPDGDRRGHIKDIVSIHQRPAAVEDRAVPGHWEGDLLSGPNNGYIATLVERHTRYVMMAKVAGKDNRTVVSAYQAGEERGVCGRFRAKKYGPSFTSSALSRFHPKLARASHRSAAARQR